MDSFTAPINILSHYNIQRQGFKLTKIQILEPNHLPTNLVRQDLLYYPLLLGWQIVLLINGYETLFTQVHRRSHADLLWRRKFDLLYSTRHYGPFLWFLATKHQLDGVLKYFLTTNKSVTSPHHTYIICDAAGRRVHLTWCHSIT